MLLTPDTSILVATVQTSEPGHQASARLVNLVRTEVHEAVIPLTVLIEVAGAIRRRTGSELLARRVLRDYDQFRALRHVDLNDERTLAAIRVASTLRLRGMDAIVVQVAQEFGATLVTLDEEMARRASGIVSVRDVASF